MNIFQKIIIIVMDLITMSYKISHDMINFYKRIFF